VILRRGIAILAAWLCLTAAATAQSTCGGKGTKAKLEAPVEVYEVSEGNFLDGLLKVAADFKLPVGIEWIRGPATLKPVRLTRRGTTPGEILQLLVKGIPGYTFDVKGETVHVYQGNLAADQRNFLNLRLPDFTARNQYIATAEFALQVRAHAALSGKPPDPTAGYAGSVQTSDGTVTLKLQNVTYRDVLDELTLDAAVLKVWVVTFSETTGPLPSGFWPTVLPKTGEPLRGPYQPGWERLGWGVKPY
jgi:hypothetical protein